jgi:pyruvate dehydrogenase E2 component (dihydrolipoamide acetyltransferase)
MPFTVYMPKLSPTMTEGVIAKWHKKVGDRVESGDVLLEISTDKATESIEGYTPKPIGQKQEATKQEVTKQEPPKQPEEAKAKQGDRVLASPLAKKLAKDRAIDLTTVQGSGPRGRIMSRDLQGETQQQPRPQAVAPSATPYTEEALTPMRQVIGSRLQESKSTIPHFYIRQEIDALPISNLREELKRLEKNVTINDFIIKAVAIALKKHPEINSGFDAQRKAALRYSRVDISVAVTIPGGLITPIVFDANSKSLSQISQEVKLLASKAREGKLSPPEYQGGSFTISNLGMFGIDEMCAIINPPQGAILGIGVARDTPVVKGGQVVAGKTMTLTLSCDHRLIDGAEAAQFMRTLRELLENPILFLSE